MNIRRESTFVCKARKQQLLLNILVDGVLCIFMVEHRFSISPLEYFSDQSLIPNRIEYTEQILGISLYSRNTNFMEYNWLYKTLQMKCCVNADATRVNIID